MTTVGDDGSCFRPVPRIAEDVKDKLLTYLFDRLRTTLAATGCPISDVRPLASVADGTATA